MLMRLEVHHGPPRGQVEGSWEEASLAVLSARGWQSGRAGAGGTGM